MDSNPAYENRLFQYLKKYVTITMPEAQAVVNLMVPVEVKKKNFFIFNNEVASKVGFVFKGCLEYYFNDEEGEKHIVYFAMENWWVGDLNSFYNNTPTIYCLQALEDCLILTMDPDEFEKAQQESPAFREFIKQSHSRATAAVTQRFVDMKSLSAEERYEKLLKTFPDLFQRVPLTNIASYLGVKPQSLSRIRKQMK